MLMATSVEIVIYAYGASQKFPWILKCFQINAFYFYKLIEIIISNEEGILNRDLIKHLNAVSNRTQILDYKKVSFFQQQQKKERYTVIVWCQNGTNDCSQKWNKIS